MKILIADDSLLVRERIRELITNNENLEIVAETDNGLDALRLVTETDPDVVILDIRMPVKNGIEVLIELKRRGCRAKICMLTNYPYKQYRERCKAEGADYFFDKNTDIQKFLDLLDGFGKQK